MANYATVTFNIAPKSAATYTTENGAGTRVINSSTTVTYVLADGGNQMIITVQVPLIRRQFDTGFQYS